MKKIITTLIVSVFLIFIVWYVQKFNAMELSLNLCENGWEGNITYAMLSDELKEIVSEDEFNDRSNEGRIAMYRKLEKLVLDDRPTEKFDISTAFWKSPCVDAVEIDNMQYFVDIQIDMDSHIYGYEVVNFTCHIFESEIEQN